MSAHVPAATTRPIEFLVASSPQSDRFTRNGYPVEPDKPGLYLATFSDSGELISLVFRRPDDEPGDWLSAQLAPSDVRAAVLLWRPPRGGDSTGPVLPVIGELSTGAAGIWMLDARESFVLDQRLDSAAVDGITYRLSAEACSELFESHP